MSYAPSQILKIVNLPTVAFPTIILLSSCCLLEVTIIYLLHHGKISTIVSTFINTLVIFAAFTPMHDAAHGSVATRQFSTLNSMVGYISGFCFPIPYPAFKHMHLLHHKHTNDDLDPDIWVAQGPKWLLPLRWLTIEIKYYFYYLPKIHTRPTEEALVVLSELIAFALLFSYLSSIGYRRALLWGWILPGRLALAALAYFFDYLPHRPHKVKKHEDPYQATCVTSLYKDQTFFLTWPLLHQNYHNIHHLAPYIPFYYYSTVWHSLKSELLSKGTQIKPILE